MGRASEKLSHTPPSCVAFQALADLQVCDTNVRELLFLVVCHKYWHESLALPTLQKTKVSVLLPLSLSFLFATDCKVHLFSKKTFIQIHPFF